MTISFSQLNTATRVPFVAVETNLVSGQTGTPSLGKRLLLLGLKTSAGSATVAEVYSVASDSVARTLFGAGSILAVMAEAALRINPRLPLYAMAYTEASGTAASGTITLTGTATGGGTLVVTIAGRTLRVGVQSTDTPTAIGANLIAAINGAVNLPVTATNNSGTVTVLARNKGTEGNTIKMRATVDAASVTVAVVAMASGATPSDPTTALAGLQGERWHHIALGTDDTTAATALKTHQEARSTAFEQKWGDGIVGSVGNATAVNALALTLDSYRMQVIWHYNAEQPVYEVIAAMAALRASNLDRKATLDDAVVPGISPQYSDADWPSTAEVSTALDNAVTPLRCNRNGTVSVVRSIGSRMTSPAYIDTNPTEISDVLDEDLITQFRNRYKGAALKVASLPGTDNVLTPIRALSVLHERLRIFDRMDYLQGVDTAIKAGQTRAEPNALDPSRLDLAFPFSVVFGAHQIAILKTFVLPQL